MKLFKMSMNDLVMYVGFTVVDAARIAVRNRTTVEDCIPLAWCKQEQTLREEMGVWATEEVEATVKAIEAELIRLGYRIA